MTTKTHAILATLFCSTICIAIFATDLQLIGLLHGPSDEKNALHQQQSVQTKLLAVAKQNENIWHWVEMADLVFETYDDIAYRDQSARILRDAGVVAAYFTLLLALVPNLTSFCYSESQRLCFLLLALPLYMTPGLVGQVVFQKTAPIEILCFKTWGLAKGLSYIGYCSIKSLLIGLGANGPFAVFLFHEFKVVMSAGFLVFLILGLMLPEK